MTTFLKLGSIAALALLMFFAGTAVGHRRTFDQMATRLTIETQGNLQHRIETLARLRTGDTDGAVAHLEQAVDTATTTLPQGRAWTELDPDVRLSLQLARAYRDVHPSSDAQAAAFLATVPPPDVQYCSPALQRLMRDVAH